MSLLDTLTSFFAPHECLGCGVEGSLLCNTCLGLLSPLPERCYRCRKSSSNSVTCKPCRSTSCLQALYACTDYDYLAKDLIWRLKYTGAQSAAKTMAQSMAEHIDNRSDYIAMPVPTATSRARQRGYDQAKLLARQLASTNKLRYADYLLRSGQTHQIGATRKQRLDQLSSAFRLKVGVQVYNQHILLVDDVLTTGATLEAAANVLRKAGAKRVEGIVFAQA